MKATCATTGFLVLLAAAAAAQPLPTNSVAAEPQAVPTKAGAGASHAATRFASRTPAGISNALVRWNMAAPGDKKGEWRFPTEQAVLASLNWMQPQQQVDGSWKGSRQIPTPMLTALVLLTYLGHGETPASPAYGATIGKALAWLVEKSDAGGRYPNSDPRNYTLPIAALALAEAYGLTQNADVGEAASNAVAAIVRAQHPSGGFSYNLGKEARDDTSFMCWCAQALAAAERARLNVPKLDRAAEKLSYAMRQNAAPDGGFGESGRGDTVFSGAAVCGLQLLGVSHVPEISRTLALLKTNLFRVAAAEPLPIPGSSRFQAAWFTTQALFLDGEESFRDWNRNLVRELLEAQIRERNTLTRWKDFGHWENRSASPPKEKEEVLLDTCYATLMLEVYYRYPPQ
jgi:hypothetical protein